MRPYVAAALVVLIVVPTAWAQTLGELNAAQGLHHSLAERGAKGPANTVRRAQESVERSNAQHNNWQNQDPEAGYESGESGRRQPDPDR